VLLRPGRFALATIRTSVYILGRILTLNKGYIPTQYVRIGSRTGQTLLDWAVGVARLVGPLNFIGGLVIRQCEG
jgi:hypothetical protein